MNLPLPALPLAVVGPEIRCGVGSLPGGPRGRFITSNATRPHGQTRAPTRTSQGLPIDEGPTTGGKLIGLALPFGVRISAFRAKGLSGKHPMIFHRGCFADSISRLQHDIRICVRHNRDIVVCDSGNVFFDETDEGLKFTAWAETTTDSRRAVLRVAARVFTQVSISGGFIDCPLKNGVRHCYEFLLREVSLVEAGRAPKTYVRYLSPSAVEQERREKCRA